MAFDIPHIAVHLLLLLVLPPFFLGVINRVKAMVAGRRGPPLLQLYFDLYKLFRRGSVLSSSASAIFRLSPVFIFAALVMAGLVLPLWGPAVMHFEGDVLLFVYFLAFGRFFIILGALDVGSSFAGMGASREAFFGALAELSLFMGLLVLVMTADSTSVEKILFWQGSHFMLKPAFFLVSIAFILVLLTENSRLPIDDPNTHLELTMIHEVMVLDYSGRELGLVLYGSAIKLFIFMILAVSVLWPQPEGASVKALGWLLLKAGGMSILIGVLESVLARVRLKNIPGLLLANFVVVVLALMVVLLGKGN